MIIPENAPAVDVAGLAANTSNIRAAIQLLANTSMNLPLADWSAMSSEMLAACDELDRRRAQVAKLEAEKRALREALSGIFAKLDKHCDAPGHSHTIAGVWDNDSSNGERAGKPCEWCAHWSSARATLQGAPE